MVASTLLLSKAQYHWLKNYWGHFLARTRGIVDNTVRDQQYNVSLVIWGENSQNEYGGPLQ